MTVKEGEKLVLSGNYAAAYAVKHAKVEVIPIYPITPQTTIVEKLVEFVENGELKAEIIHADSEHSAMAAAIGASAVGARVYTATSSHGLLYMYEMIWWASNARLPIVAGFVTRTIGPPWNIWSDHNDLLSIRDTGWIILFASNAQEIYDFTVQAFKIAENKSVRLPVGVAWDGFQVSHSYEPVEVLNEDEVTDFLPDPREIEPLLNIEKPVTIGNIPVVTDNMKYRNDMWDSLEKARGIIREVFMDYCKLAGRDYVSLVEEYKVVDADTIFIAVGAISGDIKIAIDELRKRNEKVGLARIRVLRPFPHTDIVRLGKMANEIIVIDRDVSMGFGGIIANEIRSIFYDHYIDTPVYSFIAGITGNEVTSTDCIEIYKLVKERKVKPKGVNWYYHKEK